MNLPLIISGKIGGGTRDSQRRIQEASSDTDADNVW
jgi:hypothetical protein